MTEYICEALSALAERLEKSVSKLEGANNGRDADILLSCNEAARHLGCTSSTVTRMIKDGRLRKTTIAGSTGIRLSDVMEMKTP